MTKFDFYVEKLERRRREAREEALNEALARSLAEKSKEQSLAELFGQLTFVVGVYDTVSAKTEKTLVL